MGEKLGVKINGIEKNSIAMKKSIKENDILIKINGNEIFDVLDYQFYSVEKRLSLDLLRDGQPFSVSFSKKEDDEIGLVFDTYLIDSEKRCKNNCVFCFIDQLPDGMRDTLYFKDDDSRLSFLLGNYITLTNLSKHDVERIIKMRISPVNISVHTTDQRLRCEMMGNRFAGESLAIMKSFADADIKMNAQIVVCPGYNDGENLKKTLNDLKELVPAIESVAVVPVGLTKHRDGLEVLAGFDEESARDVIGIVEEFGNECFKETQNRLAYCADEFYIKAKKEIPSADFYGEMNQLENGVGMWALLKSDFMDAAEGGEYDIKPKKISIATGVAAASLISELASFVMEKTDKIEINVYPVVNNFFGESIDVAGLVTGGDIINQLKGRDLGDLLIFPETMLRSERDMFLDNVTPEELGKELLVECRAVAVDGYELFDVLKGCL